MRLLPDTVSFYRAAFHEDLTPATSFNWKDGTWSYWGGQDVAFGVNSENKYNDQLTAGGPGIATYPVARNGNPPQDWTLEKPIPIPYMNANGVWVDWYHDQNGKSKNIHNNLFNGTDKITAVQILCDNGAMGGWQGPFQNP
jgi:hypothetical protein